MEVLSDVVEEYVGKPTFRSKWDFPSQINFENIKSIINGAKLASSKTTAKIRKNYRIVIDNNEELVMTSKNKKILTHQKFPEAFRKAHHEAGIINIISLNWIFVLTNFCVVIRSPWKSYHLRKIKTGMASCAKRIDYNLH